ncbi:Gfo/Idh/MocA family protein [Chloroflexota bacterium]
MNGKAGRGMKVGIIGAGLQGGRRAQALKEFNDKLVIVADVQLERAKLLAETMKCTATDKWETVVTSSDIEVVVVCTPPHLHELICTSALKNGKHVLCEKPLGRTVEEAQSIVNIARENGVVLKCGFNHRHHPGIVQAREWFDSGIIGELSFIRCRYGISGRLDYEKEWRMNPEISGGGQLIDQGMHVIDLSRWFLGNFTEVTGFLQTAFWDIAPVEDNAFCLLRTEKGQVASIHVSWTEWKNLFSFELFGKNGYILVEGLGGSYGVEKAVLGRRTFLAPFKEEVIEFRGQDRSWYEEWKEFSSAINDGREPLGNGIDGLKALELAGVIYQSVQDSKVVKLKKGSFGF